MSVAITLPKEYGAVAAVALLTGVLTLYQGTVTSRYRKLSGIKYPQAYAEISQIKESQDAFKLNCAQRAHVNMLEHLPNFLVSLLFAGLRYPLASAALGATWIIGRVLYTMGYTTGVPKKRYNGYVLCMPAEVGLMGVGLYSAWNMYNGQ